MLTKLCFFYFDAMLYRYFIYFKCTVVLMANEVTIIKNKIILLMLQFYLHFMLHSSIKFNIYINKSNRMSIAFYIQISSSPAFLSIFSYPFNIIIG